MSLYEELFGETMDFGPARSFYGPNFNAIAEWDRGYPERSRAYFAELDRLKAEQPQETPKLSFWKRLLGPSINQGFDV